MPFTYRNPIIAPNGAYVRMIDVDESHARISLRDLKAATGAIQSPSMTLWKYGKLPTYKISRERWLCLEEVELILAHTRLGRPEVRKAIVDALVARNDQLKKAQTG